MQAVNACDVQSMAVGPWQEAGSGSSMMGEMEDADAE